MRGSTATKIRIGRAIRVIAFGALALRAVIPVGYMPGNLLAGEFMVLCPSSISGRIILQAIGDHHARHSDGIGAENACPIGVALSHTAIPVTLQAEFAFLAQAHIHSATSRYIANRDLLAPFQPRAPPQFRI